MGVDNMKTTKQSKLRKMDIFVSTLEINILENAINGGKNEK